MIRRSRRRSRALAIELSRQSAPALAALLAPEEGSDCGAGWRELGNKLAAFDGFVDAARLLPPAASGSPRPPITAALLWALAGDPYAALWRVEGLGYALAGPAWAGEGGAPGAPPRGLLQTEALPERALIPLHLGMGMAFAERLLADLAAGLAAEPAVERLLRRFLDLSLDNARPGCVDALCEPLGFVARLLHPHLLPLLDRGLAGISPALRAFLWHGAGRGLYFLPSHALPWCNPWRRALGKALAEPPHALGRRNMLGGLAFAVALINLRQPRIVEGFLQAGDRCAACEAGAAHAVLVWDRVRPDGLAAGEGWPDLFRLGGGEP